MNHSSESIHIWTIGTLEGRLSFHDSWAQGPYPRVGLEVKIWDTFKKCFSSFLLWKQLIQKDGQTWLSLVTLTCGSWSEGQHDLYFTVQWFCLISWRLWCMHIILWDYESVWPDVWPQNKCVSLWPIFYGPVILPGILKTIWCMHMIIWDYESVWPDVCPQNKLGHCDLYFMVHWFCIIIFWRFFDVWTSYFRIMGQYDQTFDLKINVGHCDLYFVVHWFCPIYWRPFNVCTCIILWDYESVWPEV